MFEFLGVADWVVWYIISQYVGLAVLGVYLLYRARLKIAFLAVFVRRGGLAQSFVDGSYQIKKRVVKGKDMKGKGKPKRIFYDVERQIGGDAEYVYVGEKEFPKDALSVEYGKKSFSINMSAPCYRKYGYTVYYFDIDTGSCLRLGGLIKGLNPLVAQRHLKAGIWQNILMGRGLPMYMWIMIIAVVACVAVAVGIGSYFVGHEQGVASALNMTGVP